MIELATEQDHLAGANYVVVINSWDSYPAETTEECWEIILKQRFGSCHFVYSPVGLDVYEFIPY